MDKIPPFLFIFFFFLVGCIERFSNEDEVFRLRGNLQASPIIRGEAPLNFSSLQDYILRPKCMSCHSGENSKPENDPINFDSYETTMIRRFVPLLIKGKPEVSRLFISVETGEMPEQGKLHEKEIEFISNWIEACAPEETPEVILRDCPSDDDDDDDW